MTENEKARELIATSETTVKVDPQNGWYLKRFAALQFEGSVDNFGTNERDCENQGDVSCPVPCCSSGVWTRV